MTRARKGEVHLGPVREDFAVCPHNDHHDGSRHFTAGALLDDYGDLSVFQAHNAALWEETPG
ncbi:MAG: hypothetical protein JRH20_28035 [Deltaproteobacteria bacterium]|nr:hypothetical protein [Deltaproteobacteria bacterium]